ncbi:hypothetical protein EKO27_g11861, partial [Xylaria grammica]
MSSALRYRTAQNVCSALCPIEHIDVPLNKIKEPSSGWPDIRGLNSLNYSRTKWLTGDAIEVSIAVYVRGLPKSLQDKIGLGIPGVNPDVWSQAPKGRDALNMAIQAPARRALARIKMNEYSIFPICSNGNHWVLVVIHKEERPTGPGGRNEWSHVAQAAVIDSYRDVGRARLISDRLQSWLGAAGGFTYSANFKRTVWTPLQKDGSSCGPRTYWNAKQILDRLLELHEAGLGYHEALWGGLSGWFNEEFVRAEMTGRCAWDAVRAMGYNARIGVECVNRVRETPNGRWVPADQLMKPSDLNTEPEKRPAGVASASNPYWTPPSSNNPRRPSVDPETPTSAPPVSDADTPRAPLVPVPHQYAVTPGTSPAVAIPDNGPGVSPSPGGQPPAFSGSQARPFPSAAPEVIVIPDDSPKSNPQPTGKGPASSSFQARPFPSAASNVIVIPDDDDDGGSGPATPANRRANPPPASRRANPPPASRRP